MSHEVNDTSASDRIEQQQKAFFDEWQMFDEVYHRPDQRTASISEIRSFLHRKQELVDRAIGILQRMSDDLTRAEGRVLGPNIRDEVLSTPFGIETWKVMYEFLLDNQSLRSRLEDDPQ